MPLFTGLSLLVSQSGFRRLAVFRSPDVSLHLFPFMCFPLWLVVSPFWVVVSGSPGVCLSVSSFMCLSLVVSGCSDVFSLLPLGSHHFSLTICLLIHLSPDSCIFNHHSALVSDSFACSPKGVSSIICFSQSIFHFVCLPIHMSPLVPASCSCFITISL